MKIEPGIETPQVKSEDGELREPGPINPDGRIKQEGESQEERQKRFAAKRAEMKQKKLESYDYVVSCEPGAHKAGLTGEGIKLISNYVRIQQRGQWTLYHYHVSFNPPIERTVDKKAVMRPFAGGVKLGAYIFDGQSFWTAKRVAEDPAEVIKLDGALKDGTPVGIEVKLVAQLLPGDIMYLQFYSIMVRKCLSALKLDQMGRHFFDNTAAISMPNHKLELWPGFITTIRRHDAGLLYGVEITHKVIRLDNVFQVMTEIRKGVMRNREFTLAMVKEAVSAELVGTIVMTSYNRRTYRVDDIAFDETPKSTFPRENGGEVSYVDYFRERLVKQNSYGT
jgi:aubergine-like protein